MGDGLVRAALATLQTRDWLVAGKPLTGAEVVKLYHALGETDPNAKFRAVGALSASTRRFDRAIQLLKKAGLVTFDGKRWKQVSGREK